MFNAVFIIWRECFEAVLIVGILSAYLVQQENAVQAKRFMWAGVGLGVVFSFALAYAFQQAQTELQGIALEVFEASMLVVAAALMIHMSLWMKKHARSLRKNLERELGGALSGSRLTGVAAIAAIAIAREGFELVMFFYGMRIEAQSGGDSSMLIFYSAIGVLLTAITAWTYFKGLKFFKPKVFFNVTTIFLFITAGSLLMAAMRKLSQLDLIPYTRALWDTSFLLDERTSFGGFISTITGYESSPQSSIAFVYLAFWVIVLSLYFDLPSRLMNRSRR